MPNCSFCGTHYHSSPYNNTNKCDSCLDYADTEEEQYEINLLLNPSGKTPMRLIDDNDDAS